MCRVSAASPGRAPHRMCRNRPNMPHAAPCSALQDLDVGNPVVGKGAADAGGSRDLSAACRNAQPEGAPSCASCACHCLMPSPTDGFVWFRGLCSSVRREKQSKLPSGPKEGSQRRLMAKGKHGSCELSISLARQSACRVWRAQGGAVNTDANASRCSLCSAG